MKAVPNRYRVRFENLDRESTCLEGETVFQSARRAGVRIVGACGGRGVCGTCMVRVLEDEVDAASGSRTPRERKWQRSCELHPGGDCWVEVAPRSVARVVRTEVDERDAHAIAPDSAVRLHEVVLEPATLASARADGDRMIEALRPSGVRRLDLAALRKLPALLRKNDWRVRAVCLGEEAIAFAAPGRPALGLAVDLGTTNCAGYLLDLESGALLGRLGIENPQASYGADLVSRMNFAITSPEQREELRQAATTAVNELARSLCEAVGAAPEEIVDVAICGNTAMHHLLLGLPVRQLGRAPYVPAVCQVIDVRARDLDLACAPGASAHLMPNVGGFVGGDHVAALLATEARWRDTTALVLDIGTNTEISLAHAGELLTASCPSGPALEGGHISSGMRAAEGAIEQVFLENGRIAVKAIGDEEAVGLCGSGVVDAMAVLVQAGIADRGGRLNPARPEVRDRDGTREALLVPGVTFTQADVRSVQLAKAAIRSGIDLLLREAGIDERMLTRVIIAGAFGSYIRVESAVAIGLLPSLPLERFEQVGNAAGLGVRMALLRSDLRARAEQIARTCRYQQLGALPGFQKVFLSRIGF
ncbi:MAG: DUF4445 domain-containing protein [Burkholderiales bacterium]|nr:DUF4445 domain-containing protein [Burkholderiales bacterium]